MQKNLRSYPLRAGGLPAFAVEREVFGLPGKVVVPFNERLRQRQITRFDENLDKTEKLLREQLGKIRPQAKKEAIEQRAREILRQHRNGRLFS